MFNRLKNTLRHYHIDVAIKTTVAVNVVFTFIGVPTLCVGPSMEPTIDADGETAFVYKLPYIFGKKFDKGNVVVLVSPEDSKKLVCKRVAAIENEIIIEERGQGTYVMTRVPPGHYYVRGDNPRQSNDSRNYGPVIEDQLLGLITWKFSWKRYRFERVASEAPAPDYVVVESVADLHENPSFRRAAGLPIPDSKNDDDDDAEQSDGSGSLQEQSVPSASQRELP